MRLRLRNVESKETLKLEAPNSCSLQQLKCILAQSLPNSPSPASIHLSLNRKDELLSEGEESIQSLGIAAGDLIFFSLEQPAVDFDSNSQMQMELNIVQCLNSRDKQDSDSVTVDTQGGEALGGESQMKETVADMEIDSRDDENFGNSDGLSVAVVDRSFSVPGFLRKVLTEELNNDGGRGHELIVIAVHAVMMESGFVGFDKNSNSVFNRFQFRNDWQFDLFKLSLYYTLPETINTDHVKAIKLNFQTIGKFINIYGTLDEYSVKRDIYRVQLNAENLVPYLNIVWANCCDIENLNEVDADSGGISPEKEVFKFWRTVKDDLILPLSIDICQEAGLRLPACFMSLPTDVKLKIMESLSGIDLARVICVCSELRYLGSNDDLWKLKFMEEFSNRRKDSQLTWKTAFVSAWNILKTATLADQTRGPMIWPAIYYNQPMRRYPNPFMIPRLPGVIGGDHDIFPHPSGVRILRHTGNFAPACNLSGVCGRFV